MHTELDALLALKKQMSPAQYQARHAEIVGVTEDDIERVLDAGVCVSSRQDNALKYLQLILWERCSVYGRPSLDA